MPSYFFNFVSKSKISFFSQLITLFPSLFDFLLAIFKSFSDISIPKTLPLGKTNSFNRNDISPVPQHKSAHSSPIFGFNKPINFLFHKKCNPRLNKLLKKSYLDETLLKILLIYFEFL